MTCCYYPNHQRDVTQGFYLGSLRRTVATLSAALYVEAWEACSPNAEDDFSLRASRVHLTLMHKLDTRRNKSPDAFFS